MNVRKDFPFLKTGVVYFDNAASTQKPKQVIDAIADFYSTKYANIHRGIHRLSMQATKLYEEAREEIASFVNAEPEEIVFVKNTTEALNLVAHVLRKRCKRVLISKMEHHSNIVPWMLQKYKVDFLDFDENGIIVDEDKIRKADVISIVHVSNVLGCVNPIKKIAEVAHEYGKFVVVDGAQSTPHMPIDVKKLDVDFFAFSAHKMLGPTGIGALYIRKELLDSLPPYQGGGGMIKEVTLRGFKATTGPEKYEAGTPHVAGAIGFAAAVRYLKRIGMKKVERHSRELAEYAMRKMRFAEIYGPKKKLGIVAFNITGVDAHDVASILSDSNIAVRSGHHCAMPLHATLGIERSVRASFYIYNTKKEVDRMVRILRAI